MPEGFVFIHRKILENPISQNPFAFRLWMECLLQATHSDCVIDYCGEEYVLKMGCFVFGRLAWAKRLNISSTTVQEWIFKMESRGMLTRQVTRQGKATVYKIEKWEDYQKPVRSSVSRASGERQVSVTNNNEKNEKKRESAPARTFEEIDVQLTNEVLESMVYEFNIEAWKIKRVWKKMVYHYLGKGGYPSNWTAQLKKWIIEDLERQKNDTVTSSS